MFCFHDRLREFTFSDGVIIKMCPDCTAFDTKRAEVLRVESVEVPKTKEELHWKFVLEKAGLGMDVGDRPEFVTSIEDVVSEKALWKASGGNPEYTANHIDKFDALAILSGLSKRTQISYSTLDDHEWVARQRPFPHTHTMPRNFTAYCPQCTEVVLSVKRPWVVRITKGVYLPIEHECNSVRVYNLQGTLIEVKAQ